MTNELKNLCLPEIHLYVVWASDTVCTASRTWDKWTHTQTKRAGHSGKVRLTTVIIACQVYPMQER